MATLLVFVPFFQVLICLLRVEILSSFGWFDTHSWFEICQLTEVKCVVNATSFSLKMHIYCVTFPATFFFFFFFLVTRSVCFIESVYLGCSYKLTELENDSLINFLCSILYFFIAAYKYLFKIQS